VADGSADGALIAELEELLAASRATRDEIAALLDVVVEQLGATDVAGTSG
jgi:hypothetical protein